ncbi:hypothetical protein B0A48_18478 [Cryoendolithus antarcticus]|uniref:Uncharacterized protein n=1 Tax=Cryoendolithus antarcticus TaxID=1507870 RepID=A0A1V8S8B4_9PEZI|nr:hypothetical protein B0A48_18478 [Cryoendolithus antarcticus]
MANMNSATVLLGILPALLPLVGSDTAETSLLGVRRPLFAMLLAVSSPSVSPIRAFVYPNPREMLEKHELGLDVQSLRASTGTLVALIQYIVAIGAVANVVELGAELSYMTVSSWGPNETYLIYLWTFLALPVYACGLVCLRLRVHIVREHASPEQSGIRHRLAAWAWGEFTPCIFHGPIRLQLRRETYGYIFISWFTATGTVLHLVYGVLVFSSLLFISVQDAAAVVIRYLASAVLSRALVMYEISGMRQASRSSDATDGIGLDAGGRMDAFAIAKV